MKKRIKIRDASGVANAGKMATHLREGAKAIKKERATFAKQAQALGRALKDMQKKASTASKSGFTRQTGDSMKALAKAIQDATKQMAESARLMNNAGRKAVSLAKKEGYAKAVNEAGKAGKEKVNALNKAKTPDKAKGQTQMKPENAQQSAKAGGVGRIDHLFDTVNKGMQTTLKAVKKAKTRDQVFELEMNGRKKMENLLYKLKASNAEINAVFKKMDGPDGFLYACKLQKQIIDDQERALYLETQEKFLTACSKFVSTMDAIRLNDPKKAEAEYQKAKKAYDPYIEKARLVLGWNRVDDLIEAVGVVRAEHRVYDYLLADARQGTKPTVTLEKSHADDWLEAERKRAQKELDKYRNVKPTIKAMTEASDNLFYTAEGIGDDFEFGGKNYGASWQETKKIINKLWDRKKELDRMIEQKRQKKKIESPSEKAQRAAKSGTQDAKVIQNAKTRLAAIKKKQAFYENDENYKRVEQGGGLRLKTFLQVREWYRKAVEEFEKDIRSKDIGALRADLFEIGTAPTMGMYPFTMNKSAWGVNLR